MRDQSGVPKRESRTVIAFARLAAIAGALALWTPEAAHGFLFSREVEWRPIPREHLEIAEPRVDPDAGAEYLFREVVIDDAGEWSRNEEVYARVKIFDERGVDQYLAIEIEYRGVARGRRGDMVDFLAARVIAPDGSIAELEESEVIDRVESRDSFFPQHVRSFSLPALAPGSILEYQYRVVRRTVLLGLYQPLARAIPTQHLRLRVRRNRELQYHMSWGNLGDEVRFEEAGAGFRDLELHDIPGFDTAPYLPPREEFNPWFAIVYTHDVRLSNPDAYWLERARGLARLGSDWITPRNRTVRRAVESVVGDETDPLEALPRIYAFVQSEIVNLDSADSGYTAGEIDDLRENNSPAQTLRNGYGTRSDINGVFGSMAAAAGFEVRFAAVSNRADRFFIPERRIWSALARNVIAVGHEDEWLFFDPGAPYLPYGEMDWQYSGTAALIADRREVRFAVTPPETVGESRVERHGEFDLLADGTLEGEVRFRYFGQEARKYRRAGADRTQTDLEERTLEALQERFPRAEISDVVEEDLFDLEKPPVLRYRVAITGFADRTGRRLFFKPSFFAQGTDPLFTEENRIHNIYFRYPRAESDRVIISLPEGFALEDASTPQSAGSNPAFAHAIQLGMLADGRLALLRSMEIKLPLMPASAYQGVKEYFELVARQDNHLLTLRQSEESENAGTAVDSQGQNPGE